jgi:hypothetical protein
MNRSHDAIETLITNCRKVISGDFWKGDSYRPTAAVTYLLINLSDLLQRLDKLGYRVAFSDETNPCKDVTELVLKMRNAACHAGPERALDPRTSISLGIMWPRTHQTFGGGGVLENPHDDDIAFWIGRYRLYLNRHMKRALNDAIEAAIDCGCDHQIRMYRID